MVLKDCGSSDFMKSCSCAIPSPADSRTLGLDIIAPVAVCLLLATTTVTTPLNGRSVPQYVDERVMSYQCLCNSTYTSNECCGSRDELVPRPDLLNQYILTFLPQKKMKSWCYITGRGVFEEEWKMKKWA